jgi:hypothetical protein
MNGELRRFDAQAVDFDTNFPDDRRRARGLQAGR